MFYWNLAAYDTIGKDQTVHIDTIPNAGTRKSGKTRKGNRWLRTALTEAALAAISPMERECLRILLRGTH